MLKDLQVAVWQARESLLAGDVSTAIQRLDRALDELEPDRLVTASEAATLLGVKSEFMIKLWCRDGTLRCKHSAECTRVSLSEIERMSESAEVKALQELDRLHDLSEEFGVPEGLDEDELEDLATSRPGVLPWQGTR